MQLPFAGSSAALALDETLWTPNKYRLSINDLEMISQWGVKFLLTLPTPTPIYQQWKILGNTLSHA